MSYVIRECVSGKKFKELMMSDVASRVTSVEKFNIKKVEILE
jgi:hypothetical protein